MINEEIGRNYASAIYMAAEKEGKLELVLNDLKNITEVYEKDSEFRDIVNHPVLGSDERKKMLKGVFEKIIDSFSVDLMSYLVEKGRFFDIKSISIEYNKIYNSKNSIEEVEATFATEPTSEQKVALTAKLEKMTGKKIKIYIKIDKTILGGGIIKIGDKIIDGSIRRQLEMLKSSL